jgi:HD-GYP domain-containing protein (c-di-GMP phosphodiesterase class II)
MALHALDQTSPAEIEAALPTADMQKVTSPELIADVVDLKLPWMTGFSRAVAQTSAACCESAGLDRVSQGRLYRAGLIHGIGSAAIPNAICIDPATRSASAWEKFRLATVLDVACAPMSKAFFASLNARLERRLH